MVFCRWNLAVWGIVQVSQDLFQRPCEHWLVLSMLTLRVVGWCCRMDRVLNKGFTWLRGFMSYLGLGV